MKTVIYIIEKATGLKDENGVKLFYTVAARLTRGKAESDFTDDIQNNGARVRKLIATK